MSDNFMVEKSTVNDAWIYWFEQLNNFAKEGFLQESRDGNVVGEILNAVTIIHNPRENIVTSEIRNLSIKYAIGELLWYLSGSNKIDDIFPYSKVWEKLSDDGKTVNSAYGHRIFHEFGFNQWEYCKNLLIKSPNTRQAVIHIKDPNPVPSKDIPCTVCLQYFIRNNKLHATTYMRSNDIWLGFPYDLFNFTCLQIKMAMELGVELGTYTHISGSLHLYQRDIQDKEYWDSLCCKEKEDYWVNVFEKGEL